MKWFRPDISKVLNDGHALHSGVALLGDVVVALHIHSYAHALHAIPQPPVQRLHCSTDLLQLGSNTCSLMCWRIRNRQCVLPGKTMTHVHIKYTAWAKAK